MKKIWILVILILININIFSESLLIPMDETQSNHLKAYGLAYWIISDKCPLKKIYWYLNYRGGSFLIPSTSREIIEKARFMGISFEIVDDKKINEIDLFIQDENMDKVELEKAPKIAVYTPKSKNPWDDAVTLALTYAEVPYDKIYDEEIINNNLKKYDWLHSHHEDFTAQYDKFYRSFNNAPWYIKRVAEFRTLAAKLGFSSVREEKLSVAKKIKSFVYNGGFLFAMCSAPETLDIALAMEGTDYIAPEIDGTPCDKNFMQKIDFSKCLAFNNFSVLNDPYFNPKSDIDYNWVNSRKRIEDSPFELFDFSAKFDQVPTILTQNHNRIVKGFFGITTAFRENKIKKECIILAHSLNGNKSVKYLHRKFGKGTLTYLGGHDPEDYAHRVGAEPTNLNLHKHSPGYRLILNNILFPAVKKKKLKT